MVNNVQLKAKCSQTFCKHQHNRSRTEKFLWHNIDLNCSMYYWSQKAAGQLAQEAHAAPNSCVLHNPTQGKWTRKRWVWNQSRSNISWADERQSSSFQASDKPVRLAGSYRCWFVKKYCWLVCMREKYYFGWKFTIVYDKPQPNKRTDETSNMHVYSFVVRLASPS